MGENDQPGNAASDKDTNVKDTGGESGSCSLSSSRDTLNRPSQESTEPSEDGVDTGLNR